jgi:hypothetical protein
MAATTPVEARDYAPDLVGVKSRVSWSAIFSGAAVAFACYVVLTFLLGAIGVSLTESGVRANAVGVSILIAAIVTIVISLFVGGWISAQLTVGENREEAVIYGILTWAVMTVASLWFVGMGVRTGGYFAVVGGSVASHNGEQTTRWEDAARQAGVPDKNINDAKNALDPNRVNAVVNDPARQQEAREAAIAASWAALVGTLLSMAASICGALTGRGTSFRIIRATVVRQPDGGSRLIIPTA